MARRTRRLDFIRSLELEVSVGVTPPCNLRARLSRRFGVHLVQSAEKTLLIEADPDFGSEMDRFDQT